MKIIYNLLILIFFISTSLCDLKTIAVSYFDNTSDIATFNPLSKGLADMLITDLSHIKTLNIVEREKLETLLKEKGWDTPLIHEILFQKTNDWINGLGDFD